MKVITQNVKVELESAERFSLSEAKCILQNFMDTMEIHDCYNIYFEQNGEEYDRMDLQNAVDLLDAFSENSSTIE